MGSAPYVGGMWTEQRFDMTVAEVPTARAGAYKLATVSDTFRYFAWYRPEPFTFDRLDDDVEGTLSPALPFDHAPPRPYLGGLRGGFITDFPALPIPPTTGEQPMAIEGRPGVLTVKEVNGGVQWTYESDALREVMVWRRGDPWWSTLERRLMPSRTRVFLGRLVERAHTRKHKR